MSIFLFSLVAFSVLVSGFGVYQYFQINRRLDIFFAKTDSTDLESELSQHKARQLELKTLGESIRSNQDEIEKLLKSAFQKSSLVRFNPFRNTGGNQSFCMCLLDLNDSGILITAIHGRDGTRIYAKTVENGLISSDLSKEEALALKQAKNQESASADS